MFRFGIKDVAISKHWPLSPKILSGLICDNVCAVTVCGVVIVRLWQY